MQGYRTDPTGEVTLEHATYPRTRVLPCCLLPVPYSLLPVPYSPLPVPSSLFPIPCRNCLPTRTDAEHFRGKAVYRQSARGNPQRAINPQ
jgi:hypothetical protein